MTVVNYFYPSLCYITQKRFVNNCTDARIFNKIPRIHIVSFSMYGGEYAQEDGHTPSPIQVFLWGLETPPCHRGPADPGAGARRMWDSGNN
jgi:hypothetical protein